MKILYIVAHPNVDRSFNHRLTEEGVKHLKSLEHEIQLVDLYKCSYDPLIRDPEHEQSKDHLKNLEWSEVIVIQFPLYWWSCPAILKGYIDYLMPMFSEENEKMKRKVLLSVTTGGPYSQKKMDNFLSHISQQIKNCGFDVLKTQYQFGVNSASEGKRETHIENFKKRLGSLK